MAIGSLIVKIGADITGIRRDARKGAQSLGGLEGATKTLGTALKALAVGLVARELVSMVNGAMKAVDATAKLSRQLGGSIDGLQGLRLAAKLAGVDAGVLSSAMEKLNQRLGEAARKGSGEAFDAFERLGLSATKLGELDVDERIATIADRMVELGFTSQQTADTLRSLGIRQGDFANLVSEGGASIRAARQEIEDFGLSLSAVDAAKVEEANDAMERVKLASTATAQRLAVNLSPIITAVSNQFIDMAKDAGGLKESIDSVVGSGANAFGFLADSIRGVHLVLKTVELAGWALGTALVDIMRGNLQAVAFFVDGSIETVNKLITVLNVLQGTDIQPIGLMGDAPFMKALDAFADNMAATTADVFQQLKALATTEWPSEKAEKFFADIQTAADTAAQSVVESRRKIMDISGGGGEGETEQDEKEAEKLRERLNSQLNILREHSMSAEQLENERHAKRLEQLNTALDQELLSLTEFASISEGLEKRHMDSLAKTRKQGMDRVQDLSVSSMLAGAKQISSALASLTANAARENKTMFDIHKGFAIADALISGAQGVANTMGSYPFPQYIPMALAHAAAAAAQVAAIASQQFQGGGRSVAAPTRSAGASGGGGGSRGAAPQAQAGGGGVTGGSSQLVQIGLNGDTFSRGTVLALIEQLNEAVSDGARIVVV